MTTIHPTAIVSPRAELADDVEVGPYALIDSHVRVGQGTRIGHHATITGWTTMGEHNTIFPYAAIGFPPQDLTYKNEPTTLEIGHYNVIREFVTLNSGTLKGDGRTIIGHHNYFMAYAHVAHDCILEDHIVIANGVQLGGHILVKSYVGVGGLAAVHHFVTVGQYSFIAGLSRVLRDVPPYMIMEGHPARVRAVNTVGLTRQAFSPEKIQEIKDAYKLIWRRGVIPAQALRLLEERKGHISEIRNLIEFLRNTERGRQGRAREALRKPH